MRVLVVLCIGIPLMACGTHAVRCDERLRPINASAVPMVPPRAVP